MLSQYLLNLNGTQVLKLYEKKKSRLYSFTILSILRNLSYLGKYDCHCYLTQ